jgi:hypothetical protein
MDFAMVFLSWSALSRRGGGVVAAGAAQRTVFARPLALAILYVTLDAQFWARHR